MILLLLFITTIESIKKMENLFCSKKVVHCTDRCQIEDVEGVKRIAPPPTA